MGLLGVWATSCVWWGISGVAYGRVLAGWEVGGRIGGLQSCLRVGVGRLRGRVAELQGGLRRCVGGLGAGHPRSEIRTLNGRLEDCLGFRVPRTHYLAYGDV